MEQFAGTFLALMSEFVNIYEKMVALAKEKTSLLVAGDVVKLDALVKQEAELLMTAGGLERQRTALLTEWCGRQGRGTADLTFAAIVDELGQPQAAQAKEHFARLSGLLDELRYVNKTNGELIEQALHFVNYSLELMVGGDAGFMTYGAGGYTGGPPNRKVLDQKA